MADSTQGRARKSDGRLTYGGRAWRVESEPEIVDTDGELKLVEVWVRGEDIEQSE
ncbi:MULTISPECIES: hypothetical protein [unclassified Streptomyces]|uniref:hypothetical protein n=1 Tax=unclassified Streptomyces TaxID=2593676 RepID=UPI003D73C080